MFMAEFIGSIEEFHKFIGPRIRNAIQYLTKKKKKELNSICQICGEKCELEAAHIKGKDRKKIIENNLKKFFTDAEKTKIKINLENTEKMIIENHLPIEEYFKFLCAKCHFKYDSE